MASGVGGVASGLRVLGSVDGRYLISSIWIYQEGDEYLQREYEEYDEQLVWRMSVDCRCRMKLTYL